MKRVASVAERDMVWLGSCRMGRGLDVFWRRAVELWVWCLEEKRKDEKVFGAVDRRAG